MQRWRAFENRKRRRHSYFVFYQFVNGFLHCFPIYVKLRQLLRRSGRTDVRLLAGMELGVHHQAVLQIIDPERGRLAKSHRAEVPGHFQSACVSCCNRCLQLPTRNVHVGLEGMCPHLRPVLHEPASVVWRIEFGHLRRETVMALEIPDRDQHLGTGHAPLIDHFFQI